MSAGPLRVLHVLGELRASGAEVMMAVAAPTFRELGVSVEILSTGEERIGRYAERLRDAGYPVHHIPFSRSFRFFWRLFRFVRSSYDAVHIHTERATFWVGLALWLAGVPVMLKSIHSAFKFEGGLRWRRRVQRHVLAWIGLRQIAVGRSVQQTELERFGLETPVINNWYDADWFRAPCEDQRRAARQALGCEDGDVVLVTVANCDDVKNHAALLRAVALLEPERRPLWLHVGEEEYGQPERSLAAELGIAERVRFLGSLDDVRAALHAADCFVMPSLREGLPISALEALATGLPAILGDAEGLRDLRSAFPGLLYAEPSPVPLAEALRNFLDLDPDARRRLARAYPEIAREHWGVRRGVEAYVKLYRGGRWTA